MNHTYKRDVVFKNENIEVVEIEWQPGESSPVHEHGACSGMVHVIAGEVYEVPYTKAGNSYEPREKRVYTKGDCFREEALGAHKVGNESSAPAKTIHVYLPQACNTEIEL